PYCFYESSYHRDLHSFPTRRSSDLVSGLVYVVTPVKLSITSGCPTINLGRAFTNHRSPGLFLFGVRASPRNASFNPSSSMAYRRDRKSTRLNSSHVEISYAVFCLKK